MLYAISDSYFIDITEISHIRCEDNPGDSTYPYRMYIRMKDGQAYVTWFSTAQRCKNEISRIADLRNRMTGEPVTRYELEQITRNEAERLKRYIGKLFKGFSKEAEQSNE